MPGFATNRDLTELVLQTRGWCGVSDLFRKYLNVWFILALTTISIAACTSRKIDFDQVLNWLPADTETRQARTFYAKSFFLERDREAQ